MIKVICIKNMQNDYKEIEFGEIYYISEVTMHIGKEYYHIYNTEYYDNIKASFSVYYNGCWNSDYFITEVEYRNKLIKEILE